MNILDINTLSKKEAEEISELLSWLPKSVVDFHMHCHGKFSNRELINIKGKVPSEMFNYFEYEKHVRIFFSLFPGVEWRWSMIGLPLVGHEEENNNDLLRLSKIDKRVIPIFSMTEKISEDSLSTALSAGFAGLKMYPSVNQKVNKTRVVDVFPEGILKIVDDFRSFVVLHLPNNLVVNLDELCNLAQKYKRTKFLIAHMGNHQELSPEVEKAFASVSSLKNIYLDTAFNASRDVIQSGIQLIGADRIVFGSDAPLAYLRGVWKKSSTYGSIRIQGREKWSWLDPCEFELYKDECDTYGLLYVECLKAVRDSIRACKFRDLEEVQVKNMIFRENALRIIEK